MYAPTTQTVSSGLRGVQAPRLNVDIAGDMKSDFQDIGKAYLDNHNKKYQESTDFYDLQKEESDSFYKALDGLEGKDYEYMLNQVTESRNRLAEVFKGKKLQDYNTPEFQKQLYEIKKNLGLMVNNSQTSISSYKNALGAIKEIPHYNQGAAKAWIEKQMQLPPQDRDPNPVATLNSDPQFRNTLDFVTKWMTDQGISDYDVVRKSGNLNIAGIGHNFSAMYDKAGKSITSDATVDQMFNDAPWFKTAMENMARNPQANKELVDAGATYLKDQDLRAFTKRYLETVSALKNREDLTAASFKQPPTAGLRPTSAQLKEDAINDEAKNLFESLLKNPKQALLKYTSPKKSLGAIADFDPVTLGDGSIRITPAFYEKKKRGKDGFDINPDPTKSFIIDPKNQETIKSFLDWVKRESIPTGDVPEETVGASGINWN